MDQMAAAAYAAEVGRMLESLAVEAGEAGGEVRAAANVQWASPAADAFRHALVAAVRDLPGLSDQLRAAAYDLLLDPTALATGS